MTGNQWSIVMNLTSLERQLLRLKSIEISLSSESPNVITNRTEVINASYGRSFEAVNEAYRELNNIEDKMLILVGNTIKALENAGISMEELDNKLAGEIDEFALIARWLPMPKNFDPSIMFAHLETDYGN